MTPEMREKCKAKLSEFESKKQKIADLRKKADDLEIEVMEIEELYEMMAALDRELQTIEKIVKTAKSADQIIDALDSCKDNQTLTGGGVENIIKALQIEREPEEEEATDENDPPEACEQGVSGMASTAA